MCGGGQHVVGRLGLSGQGDAAEPGWCCLGRRLGWGGRWGRDREGQVRWTWKRAAAEPGPQDCVTSPKEGSQKWESLEETRGARRTAIPACVSGTTDFSSAQARAFSQGFFPSLTAPVLVPQTPPDNASHLSPALLLTKDSRPLLLSVISEYTFLLTEKWQHQSWLYSCPSMSSCI